MPSGTSHRRCWSSTSGTSHRRCWYGPVVDVILGGAHKVWITPAEDARQIDVNLLADFRVCFCASLNEAPQRVVRVVAIRIHSKLDATRQKAVARIDEDGFNGARSVKIEAMPVVVLGEFQLDLQEAAPLVLPLP